MRRLGFRAQRTLAQSASVSGVGFLSGQAVRLRFVPADPDTGIVFVRTDVRPQVRIPARLEQVTGTSRRTTLGTAPTQVQLVEHVLAALAGLRIDNCLVELDAAEPPGLDGSSAGFVTALTAAGTVVQSAWRGQYTPTAPVTVQHDGATLTLYPHAGHELRVSYRLDYGPQAPIAPQTYTNTLTPAVFAQELADSRTFLLEAEAHALRAQGIGYHLKAADVVVFDEHGPIDNRLRHADEPARHKALDLIGDLALFGADLCGHLVAYRSGHTLNVALARTLARQLVSTTGRHAA
jgi:UDP-3-O-acyl N-acetylglucosamine deacetylase